MLTWVNSTPRITFIFTTGHYRSNWPLGHLGGRGLTSSWNTKKWSFHSAPVTSSLCWGVFLVSSAQVEAPMPCSWCPRRWRSWCPCSGRSWKPCPGWPELGKIPRTWSWPRRGQLQPSQQLWCHFWIMKIQELLENIAALYRTPECLVLHWYLLE